MLIRKLLASWQIPFFCLMLAGCGGVSLFAVFTDDNSQLLPFQVFEKTSASAISERRMVVIRDLTAWESLWAEHVANLSPPLARPAINFSQDMVIGVFLGNRSNGCYAVSIESVWHRDDPERIEVTFRESPPSVGDVCTTVISNPATFIITPYSPLPVSFLQAQ